MYVVKDECVIGGDKVCTPFGELTFKRVYETNDERIAEYFRNKTGYTVTEVTEDSEDAD